MNQKEWHFLDILDHQDIDAEMKKVRFESVIFVRFWRTKSNLMEEFKLVVTEKDDVELQNKGELLGLVGTVGLSDFHFRDKNKSLAKKPSFANLKFFNETLTVDNRPLSNGKGDFEFPHLSFSKAFFGTLDLLRSCCMNHDFSNQILLY